MCSRVPEPEKVGVGKGQDQVLGGGEESHLFGRTKDPRDHQPGRRGCEIYLDSHLPISLDSELSSLTILPSQDQFPDSCHVGNDPVSE